MDVKKAAETAKAFVIDLFAEEQIEHVGLEEVKFDRPERAWDITIGFSRAWQRSALAATVANPTRRTYKIVRIDDRTGEIVSVSHRVVAGAG